MRPGMVAEALGFEWLEERAVDDFVFMCMLLDSSRIRRPPHSWAIGRRGGGTVFFMFYHPKEPGPSSKPKIVSAVNSLRRLTYFQLVQPYLPSACHSQHCL